MLTGVLPAYNSGMPLDLLVAWILKVNELDAPAWTLTVVGGSALQLIGAVAETVLGVGVADGVAFALADGRGVGLDVCNAGAFAPQPAIMSPRAPAKPISPILVFIISYLFPFGYFDYCMVLQLCQVVAVN